MANRLHAGVQRREGARDTVLYMGARDAAHTMSSRCSCH